MHGSSYNQAMKVKVASYLAFATPLVLLTFLINHFVPSVSPLFLSLLVGLVIGNLLPNRSEIDAGAPFMSRYGMRTGIALLGFQISFSNLESVGWKGFSAILIVVITTFTITRWLGIRLGFTPGLSLLLASGFSICGASAIAAVGSARKSDKDEISYAVGLVTLLGTLSIFVIPPIAKVLNLTNLTAGSWIGAAVHDIGQVIATASFVGGNTIKYAVITKLSRVVLLAPLLILLSLKGNSSKDTSGRVSVKNLLPPFILFFIAVVILNNFLHLSSHQIGALNNVSKFLLAFGLFSMAIKVRFAALRKIGGKPLIFGITMWVIFGAFSLGVIKLFGI